MERQHILILKNTKKKKERTLKCMSKINAFILAPEFASSVTF